MAKELKEVVVKAGGQTDTVNVPIMQNTKKIAKGDIICVLQNANEPPGSEEEIPAPKRPRKGFGKGKHGKSK